MSFQRKSTGPRPPVPHGERRRAGGRRKLDSRSTRRWGSPAGFFLSAPNHLWNPDSATPCPDAPPARCPAGQGGSEARSKKAGPTWCPWLDSQPYPLHRILPLSHPGSGIRPRNHNWPVYQQVNPAESRWQGPPWLSLGLLQGWQACVGKLGYLAKETGPWASRCFCSRWRQNPDALQNWSLVRIICLLSGSCKYTSKCLWLGEILRFFPCCTNGQCLCMICDRSMYTALVAGAFSVETSDTLGFSSSCKRNVVLKVNRIVSVMSHFWGGKIHLFSSDSFCHIVLWAISIRGLHFSNLSSLNWCLLLVTGAF